MKVTKHIRRNIEYLALVWHILEQEENHENKRKAYVSIIVDRRVFIAGPHALAMVFEVLNRCWAGNHKGILIPGRPRGRRSYRR